MTLDQIKKHPLFPFRDFRSNDLAFHFLELYWEELFKSSSTSSNGLSMIEWTPLSAPDRDDANPIFHAIDRSTIPPRALRIIQRFNEDNLVELDLEKHSPIRFT